MKDQVAIPSQRQLLKYYNLFQSNSANLADLIACFQWSRFDPRLGEILIKFISREWVNWNPLMVRTAILKTECPAVFLVLCEHVISLVDKRQQQEFRAWFKCVAHSVPLPPTQFFFLGVHAFGGRRMQQDLDFSLDIYKRWGFLSSQSLISDAPLSRTRLHPSQRLELLGQLLKQKPRITVSDYINFLEGQVSRRTAELDLKTHLRKSGQTKGASYRR